MSTSNLKSGNPKSATLNRQSQNLQPQTRDFNHHVVPTYLTSQFSNKYRRRIPTPVKTYGKLVIHFFIVIKLMR